MSRCVLLLALLGLCLPVFPHGDVIVLQCDEVGLGGDNAAVRGIRFEIDESFVSVEVRMDATISGLYTFDAELRRSPGFVTPPEQIASVSVLMPATLSTPFPEVHFDFPNEVVVNGPSTETFTLRFVNFNGPGAVFMEAAGIGNFPCMNAIITDENNVAFPTPRTSATGFTALAETPPPSDPDFIRGDVDSSGDFNALVDTLYLLAFGFQAGPAPLCLESGDVDGDGALNTLVDALFSLAHGFQGGVPPAPPYPDCGIDPSPPGLGCDESPGCP